MRIYEVTSLLEPLRQLCLYNIPKPSKAQICRHVAYMFGTTTDMCGRDVSYVVLRDSPERRVAEHRVDWPQRTTV